jgi:hypothetical protein
MSDGHAVRSPPKENLMAMDTNAVETMPEAETSRWKGRRRGAQAPASAPANGGAVYGLGMIGALAWFIQTAETRADYALAFPKALVWPAILVFRLFRYLEG